MADPQDNPIDSRQLIANLNKQVSELKGQLSSATLEMEMMRARMNDLRSEARQVVNVERFRVPDRRPQKIRL